MHHKNLKIISTFNVVNLGRTIITDVLYNSHTKDFFQPKDTFRHGDTIYRVKSVEPLTTKMGTLIGLKCERISPKELWETHKKVVKKENLIQIIIKKIKSWVEQLE